MPGEWLQRGGILEPGPRKFGLNLRWPRKLRGSWLQSSGFLLIGLFSALTLTSARVTGWVLLGLFLLAFILSLVFERRAFCTQICPIGGFTGLYAQAAPLELRVKDADICAAHTEKTCYTACPWGQYPLALKSSANCGLCMECLRVCPSDNLAVNLRPWGADLQPANKHRLDEAFLGLVMLGSALADAAIFLGPWGELKNAAYKIGSTPWFLFAGGFLLINLVILPGLYGLAVWLGRKISARKETFKAALAGQSAALIPLGLAAWIAFTVAFAFAKFAYVPAVLSDPLGLGWNLLSLSGPAGVGQATPLSLILQVAILVVGIFSSARVARKNTTSTADAAPVTAFAALFSLAMLVLLVG